MTKKLDNQLSIKMPRKVLLNGINTVARAIEAKANPAILTHVLISQDEETGKVVLTGTNLEIWMRHTINPASMHMGEHGQIAVPVKSLADALAVLPDADVTLTADGNNAVIACGRAKYKLLSLATSDYPPVPEIEHTCRIGILGRELSGIIQHTTIACALNDTRPAMTGVYFECGATLKAVATDTHHIGIQECADISMEGAETSIIVPAKALNEISKVCAGQDETVSLSIGKDKMSVDVISETNQTMTTIVSRLIDSKFVDYARAIPAAWDRRITVDREYLIGAVRRAGVVARAEGSANRLNVAICPEESEIILSAVNGNVGDVGEGVDVAYEGNQTPVYIALNVAKFQSILESLGSESVCIEMPDAFKPAAIRGVGDSSYFYVILPLQPL